MRTRLSERKIKAMLVEIQTIAMNGNIMSNDDRLKVMSNTVAIWRSLFGRQPMKVGVQVSSTVSSKKIERVLKKVANKASYLP